MVVVSLKVGVAKQNFFAALRALNNMNSPFRNPASVTDIIAWVSNSDHYSGIKGRLSATLVMGSIMKAIRYSHDFN